MLPIAIVARYDDLHAMPFVVVARATVSNDLPEGAKPTVGVGFDYEGFMIPCGEGGWVFRSHSRRLDGAGVRNPAAGGRTGTNRRHQPMLCRLGLKGVNRAAQKAAERLGSIGSLCATLECKRVEVCSPPAVVSLQ